MPDTSVSTEPVEAPGAVSIGTIGMAIMSLLFALMLVMDITTCQSNIDYAKECVTSRADDFEGYKPRQKRTKPVRN